MPIPVNLARNPAGNQGVVFGPGNFNVTPTEIQQFLNTPGLNDEQILKQAQAAGVSLAQIQSAVPNNQTFAASNPNLLPFLASQGITPPQQAAPQPVAPFQQVVPQQVAPPQQSGIPTGLQGSEQALQGGLESSIAGLLTGINQSRADLSAGRSAANAQFAQGVAGLQPFTSAGSGAVGLQSALSGASGADAQAQAFADFRSSPGQDFLRDRGERALTRNAAATGGLGGGRVRQALQREGIGFAQQDIDNQFARLSDVARSGLSAGGTQAGLFAQNAGLLGNLAQQQSQASLTGGITAAQLGFDTGQSLAAGRTRVGEQLASEVSDTTSALASLVNQQGAGVSDLTGSTSGNLSQLLLAATQAQEAGQTQLATLLANLATGAGSNLAAVRPVQGILPSILNSIGAVASGASGFSNPSG